MLTAQLSEEDQLVLPHPSQFQKQLQAQARSRLAKVIHYTDDDFKQAVDDSFFTIEDKLFARDFDKTWNSSYDGLAYVGDAAALLDLLERVLHWLS